MVNMKRCEKGHFYDAEKYPMCPYCNSSENGAMSSNGNKTFYKPVSVQGNLQGAYGGDCGKTMPLAGVPFAGGQRQNVPQDDSKTVAVINKRIHNEDNVGINPVSGWLVCIAGHDKGRDYRIFAGNNFIGRAEDMDICIQGDETISREKHACVTYDDKKNKFYIYQGDSRGLVYLNDETVFVPQLLKPYDIIEVGSTKLMFIPFCSENFKWE